MADTCPHCGAALGAHAIGSTFDDEPTPVDPRFGDREAANVQLLENELKRQSLENERLAVEVAAAMLKLEESATERRRLEEERDRLRAQNNQLRLALRGRFRKPSG